MALLRTLNTLRRETLGLALQTLGLQPHKEHAAKGQATLYRTFDRSALRRVATPQPMRLPAVLQVLDVVRETADAVSLVVVRTDGQPVDFKAGMFFTVVVTIDGQEYRRAYSASSAAHANSTLSMTVKRVPGGTVSNWINDHIAVGSTLRVLGPSGNFVLAPESTPARTLLLVGGGSGITPLMSITRTVLALEPASHIHLIYGNRSKKDVIFYAALSTLQKQYPTRLAVTHVLEKPPKGWAGAVGRLDRTVLAGLLDRVVSAPDLADLHVYTCGPEPVMAAVSELVLARGLDAARLHQEKFTPAAGAADTTRFTPQTAVIHGDGTRWTTTVQAGQTLLEAGLASGAPMAYSCTLGGCGRCRVKVTHGAVDMPEPNCLLPEEKAQGYALSCIARPCSAVHFTIAPPQAH